LVTKLGQSDVPKPVLGWFPIAGYATLVLTLLFLMVIYAYSVTIRPIQQDVGTRMILVFVVSLALAMGLSFIGGDAIAKGRLPFFENALSVSLAGGVAVWVVGMIIGYQLFAKGPNQGETASAPQPGIHIDSGVSIQNANIGASSGGDNPASAPSGR
jgi:hypothetical protein